MTGSDLLITILILSVVTLVLASACWIGEVQRAKRQEDWRGENGSKAIR